MSEDLRTNDDAITYLPVREFRELGFLQEINRQILHPAGLALEVVVNDDGTERLGGIWDCRRDPEGVLYGDVDADKAARVWEAIYQEDRAQVRSRLFGAPDCDCGEPHVVQPIDLTVAVDAIERARAAQ